jgi:thiamine pyridinylase
MDAKNLFGMVLVMIMLHFNMVEMKSYSQPSAIVENAADDELATVRRARQLHYSTILNVALFPYLPDLEGDDHRSLLHYIEDEFYKVRPDVFLALRKMNVSDEFYNPEQVIKWLGGSSENVTIYDVVEVDTVILGDLVDAAVADPLPFPPSAVPGHWNQAAAFAVEVNKALYAYPHLMCTFFLFTRDSSIGAANTVDELTRAIRRFSIANGGYLAGNLHSTWDLTAMYVDSYREANFPNNLPEANALHGPWSNAALDELRELAQLCNNSVGQNDCLNGNFDNANYDVPAELFGLNKVKAIFGYSERLFQILKTAASVGPVIPSNYKIKPLPLGKIPNQPLFFTDAFVIRRNMSEDKARAAIDFASFMATPKMQAAVVAGVKPTGPYRYLLPMSSDAYKEFPLNSDYFYQTFFRNVTGGWLPNTGFSKVRKTVGSYVAEYMGKP